MRIFIVFLFWWQMNTHRTAHSNRSANKFNWHHDLIIIYYSRYTHTCILLIIITTILYGLHENGFQSDTEVGRDDIPQNLVLREMGKDEDKWEILKRIIFKLIFKIEKLYIRNKIQSWFSALYMQMKEEKRSKKKIFHTHSARISFKYNAAWQSM